MQRVQFIYAGSNTRKMMVSGCNQVIVSGDSGSTVFDFTFPSSYSTYTKEIVWGNCYVKDNQGKLIHPRYELTNNSFQVPDDITHGNSNKTLNFQVILTSSDLTVVEKSLAFPVFIAPSADGEEPANYTDVISQLCDKAYISSAYSVNSTTNRPIITFTTLYDKVYSLQLNMPYLDQNGKVPSGMLPEGMSFTVHKVEHYSDIASLTPSLNDMALITVGNNTSSDYIGNIYLYTNSSSALTGWVQIHSAYTDAQIDNKVDKVAGKGLSTNDYTTQDKNKLSGIQQGAEVNVQSDWTQTTTTADDYIKNKPNLQTVATTGSYNDLSDKPAIPQQQVQTDWTETDTSSISYIQNKPTLQTVATSGDYNDLSNKPSVPQQQIQSDWTQQDNTKKDFIKNKPNLQTVATSGSYTDLINKPNLQPVATSGSYTDLSDKPTIPQQQIQSDWQQSDTTALDYIKSKPTIPTQLSQLTEDSTHRVVTDSEKSDWNDKQDELVSGQNIKTVNSQSILGSGDISITSQVAWGNITGTLSNQSDLNTQLSGKQNILMFDDQPAQSSQNPVKSGGIYTQLEGKADTSDIPIQGTDYLTPTQISNAYVAKETGKGLSTNDYSTQDKTKLAGIEQGAEVNDVNDVQVDGSSILSSKIANLITTNSQSSNDNSFALKGFVNSSIASATAFFKGTYNQVSQLLLPLTATDAEIGQAIATHVGPPITNNDYVYVSVPRDVSEPTVIGMYRRFKYVSASSTWIFEFELNNSSFTATQWQAINSGITQNDVTQIGNKIDKANVGSATQPIYSTTSGLVACSYTLGQACEKSVDTTLSSSATGVPQTATVYSAVNDKVVKQNVGSATQPIYLTTNGAVACTYTLAKSVPQDAVFTDTTYTGSSPISINSDNVISVDLSGYVSKPNASVGSSTKGIYYDSVNGLTQCTYSVSKDVPQNAIFTDTIYTAQSPISIDANNKIGIDLSSYVTLTGSQALTNKTYNGYTLAQACAKGVDTSTLTTSSDAKVPSSKLVNTELGKKISLPSANIGSSTKPVYIQTTGPVECLYTLADACAKGVDTTISNTSSINLPTSQAVATYVGSQGFLTQHQSVINGGNTASWGQSVTVGTIGSTSLTFTMPANPNTDTNVARTISATNSTYPLLATTVQDASSSSTGGTLFASAIKLNPSTGTITASKFSGAIDAVTVSQTGTSSTTIKYLTVNNNGVATEYKIGGSSYTAGTGIEIANDTISTSGYIYLES